MRFPVFTAFGASISYVATHFLALVRVAWLPAALLMAAMAYLLPSVLEAQLNIALMETGEPNPAEVFAALGKSMQASSLVYLASAIFYPMIIAGVLRHVLRGDLPKLPFYLWFGADEFRVVVSFIIFYVMMVLAAIAAILGLFVAILFASMVSEAAAAIIAVVLGFSIFIAYIWFLLRMSMIMPATIDKREIGIGHSWAATAGNVWGLMFYWILWGVVLAFVGGILSIFMVSAYMPLIVDAMSSAASDGPAAVDAFEQKLLELQRSMYDPANPRFWMFIATGYISTVVVVSFQQAAGGVAWRYLTGSERG